MRKTIESIISQTTRDFEYIVIDGGSTDGSLDIIKEYADRIDYWVSEPDKGVYNAMNKGIQVAHGEYCNFMNSGDWMYTPTVIEDFFRSNPSSDVILGKTATTEGGRIVIDNRISDYLTFFDIWSIGIIHQSTFIRTELLRINPYDESMRICADLKFWIDELINKNRSFSTIDTVVAFYDTTGISSLGLPVHGLERGQILEQSHIPPRVLADYTVIDQNIKKVAEVLHPYDGLKKLLCSIVVNIVKVYAYIRMLFGR